MPNWKEEVKKIQQCPQRQDSTQDQMLDLLQVANKLGFYDAADFIKQFFKDRKEKEELPTDIVLLKHIELIETYEYYDRPILFLAKDRKQGGRYIGVLSDEGKENGKYFEAFFLIPVGETDIKDFESKKISLRSLMLSKAWLYEMKYGEGFEETKIRKTGTLEESDLPDEESYL